MVDFNDDDYDGNGNQLPHQVTVVVLIIMIMMGFNDDDYDGNWNKLPHQVKIIMRKVRVLISSLIMQIRDHYDDVENDSYDS